MATATRYFRYLNTNYNEILMSSLEYVKAHPNVKLFVTHAGLLSTIETIYHGVPILATPLGGDQNMNAQQMANEGFGLVVNFPDISEQTLTEKLTELLNNPK
jgi:UDP:flavonoid glycosyltransferase YjiC (YdhE family)